jgi:hypothetical protein
VCLDAKDGICNHYPRNKILLTPGFVFIRNDFIEDASTRN